jgi:hypothetical protein
MKKSLESQRFRAFCFFSPLERYVSESRRIPQNIPAPWQRNGNTCDFVKSGPGWIEVGPWDTRLPLVVDGAEEICELFTEILGPHGRTVLTATRGEDATGGR